MSQSNEKAKVGRPPRTSAEEILEEATELLREEGYQAFSMRRLATRLGTAPTAIYTFYKGKHELLQALAQSALQDMWVELDDSAAWEEALREWMLSLRRALLDAKWLETAGLRRLNVAVRAINPENEDDDLEIEFRREKKGMVSS